MNVIGDIKVFLVSDLISNTNVLSIGHAYSYYFNTEGDEM